MKFVLLFFVFTSTIITSCNSNKKPKKEEGGNSGIEKLKKEIDDIHVTAMSKMAALTKLEQQAKTVLDSISKLPNKEPISSFKTKLEKAAADLTDAEANMENWMNDFYVTYADTLTNKEDQLAKYLEDQKTKVTAVRDAVLRNIQKADSLFKTKF